MPAKTFSHLDSNGKARMVDVGHKNPTARYASAACEVHMNSETFLALCHQKIKKGDAFTVAQIAGILAAKKTSEFIPLCHPLALENMEIHFKDLPSKKGIRIESEVKTNSKTGVEMEALHAVLVAALTIYDMAKSYDPGMVITEAKLLKKTGGKSDYAAASGNFNGQ